MTDIEALVEGATAKGTFDVIAAAKGRAYPTDSATIYTDSDAAYRIEQLERLIADTSNDNKKLATLERQVKTLVKRIKDTAIVIHLHGISRDDVDAIEVAAKEKFEDISEGEGGEWCNDSYLAKSIVRVENAEGATDARVWAAEDVKALRNNLPPEEFEKISNLMASLTFTNAFFDAKVNSDF